MNIKEKAKQFAIKAHDGIGQKRKYTGLPYWVHCEEVAGIVERAGGTDEMVAAAWLHDTVEDAGVSLAEITKEFGPLVAKYVECLTDVSKKEDGNRKVRKEIDRKHTAQACQEAKTIKLADLISNGKDIAKNDPDFAVVYMKEKRLLLEVLKEGSPILYAEAQQLIEDYYRSKK